MVFSPGQVRQKGCHFRGVDIIERAVDVPRIWAGALEQCLNYLVAKDVAVHLDLQEMALMLPAFVGRPDPARKCGPHTGIESRSEEHTSELQSLMRISYAVFCLKKKKTQT